MHFIDYIIFAVYFAVILWVGLYFFRKNESREDYFVGNRSISAGHVGMSIVATDVGGGFSIGLGGLGFIMGIAGSWLLFTGLIGAWLTAVLIIPKIKKLDRKHGMLTYPDFLRLKYNDQVATVAAIISGVGYLGFTGAQILAGAKLAGGTVFADIQWADPVRFALYVMAAVVLLYTVLGGLKAVIYTDTIQWIILLAGLSFFGLPFAYHKVGGWAVMQQQLPAEFFSFGNISAVQFINWFFTIVPIWFIAMTLYQRIFACKNERDAKRAFFIAGVLEYPVMAILGVTLGMMARVVFPDADPEMGMPRLLKHALPIGITGIVISAYFSAIMSTADSCLIASSGNFVNDIIERYWKREFSQKELMHLSQAVTLIIGTITVLIASSFDTVLEIILHAYSFMVAGLFVPTLAAYFIKKVYPAGALASMIGGGSFTLFLIFSEFKMPWGLDPSIYGIAVSALIFGAVALFKSKQTGVV